MELSSITKQHHIKLPHGQQRKHGQRAEITSEEYKPECSKSKRQQLEDDAQRTPGREEDIAITDQAELKE